MMENENDDEGGRGYLRIPIQRMKSMTRKRCRNNPLMMRLMQRLIHKWMMQSTMNPINQAIRKDQKQRELKHHIPPSIFLGIEIKFAVSADFG